MLAGTVMCGPTHWLARGHHDEVEAGADTLVDTARRQVTRADRTDDSDVARTIVHRWLAHVGTRKYGSSMEFTNGQDFDLQYRYGRVHVQFTRYCTRVGTQVF